MSRDDKDLAELGNSKPSVQSPFPLLLTSSFSFVKLSASDSGLSLKWIQKYSTRLPRYLQSCQNKPNPPSKAPKPALISTPSSKPPRQYYYINPLIPQSSLRPFPTPITTTVTINSTYNFTLTHYKPSQPANVTLTPSPRAQNTAKQHVLRSKQSVPCLQPE